MKIYPFKIPKPKENQLIVQEDQQSTFYNKLHQHEEIQLSLIVKGQGKLLAGDSIHQYKNQDFFVIGSNLPHMFQSEFCKEDSHMISLFFTKSTFGETFFNLPDVKDLNSFFTSSESGFKVLSHKSKIIDKIHQILQTDKTKRFIVFLELILLLKETKKNMLTNFIYTKVLSSGEGERLRVVVDFVIQNFDKPIQLRQVAKMSFLTPNAFCRFFKQRTNKTFFQFLIEIRIEHACHLLISKKDLNISEIAELSGFNSSTNFNKKFKMLKGVNPSKYRYSEN